MHWYVKHENVQQLLYVLYIVQMYIIMLKYTAYNNMYIVLMDQQERLIYVYTM